MLQERYSINSLQTLLCPTKDWHPWPKATDRRDWNALLEQPLNQARKARLVAQAESFLCQAWPSVPALRYMDYERNGDRARYQDLYEERRRRLIILAVAECMEDRGRFVDEIINGIWTLCEETTWIVPAHADRAPGGLPRLDRHAQRIDLFATQTAQNLGFIWYLLDEKLDAVSPVIHERILQQVNEQVLVPIEARDDLKWMSGRNNWTPWICSNALAAAFCLWQDEGRIARLTHRLMGYVDRFIDGYGPDGGCDEGPTYWGQAAGAMLRFLEWLYSRSDGAVSIYKEPIIRNMGEYIARTYMDGGLFANYSDAMPHVSFSPGVVYRYGERTGSELMQELAIRGAWGFTEDEPVVAFSERGGWSMMTLMTGLFWWPAERQPGETKRPLTSHWPDLEQVVLRASADWNNGVIVTCKGGHNAQSHNHNDIGHMMIMRDGQYIVVDVGAEMYTAITFTERRYELWNTRGSAHNAPVLNGIEQAAGVEYAARQVAFREKDDIASYTLDLAGCYPTGTIKTAQRSVTLDRARATIALTDSIQCEEPNISATLTFYTPEQPISSTDGDLQMGNMLLHLSPDVFSVKIEEKGLDDRKMRTAWGESLWAVRLSASAETSELSYTLVWEPAE